MKLIVGLGNPGPRYETTRHNIGFLVVDELAHKFGMSFGGRKFDAEFASDTMLGERVLLIKPQTYMNLSGKSVAAWMQFYKLAPQDLIVVFDDVDLESGRVKARAGGGTGGHNGIKSIIECTGSADFHRVKIGVGRPKEASDGVRDWVLQPMSDPELLAVQNEVLEAVLLRIKGIFDSSKS